MHRPRLVHFLQSVNFFEFANYSLDLKKEI